MNNLKTAIKVCFILLIGVCITNLVSGQNAKSSGSVRIKGLPGELKIFNDPLNLQVVGDSIITITSRGNTNLFNNPNGNDNDHNAPMLLFHPDSDFVLSAKITADLKEEYDVASLVMFQDNDLWAKLCFENSCKMERNVVSVVTKKYSDDCNSVKIYKNFGYFLIAKKGEEFSFHYSIDNKNWDLIRHFRLKSTDLMIGFAVQCYSSKSFYASFSDIKYSNTSLEDMRNYK